MEKIGRKWIVVLMWFGVGLGIGCSERSTAAPECEVDSDCVGEQVCDLGLCRAMQTVEATGSGDGDGDGIADGDGTSGDGDGTSGDGSGDSSGDGTVGDGDGSGDGDGTADDGDGDVDPPADFDGDGSGGDDTGDGTGDQSPAFCTMVGESCVPGTGGGAGLVCVEQNDGSGVCRASCERPGHADGCAVGHYCVEDGGEQYCAPSECMTHGECTNGSCVLYDNDYRTCIQAGPLGPEETCVGGGTRCQPGYFCDAPSEGMTGSCMPLCDPFSVSPCADAISEACTVRWRRTGVCTTYPYLADTLQSFNECSAPGDWCTDAVECRGSGTTGLCFPYCRPGQGDCVGESLPSGGTTICDNYWFPGDQSLGLCTPPCASDADCGDTYDCVDQICRKPCPTGNPISDCCSGSIECDYYCEAGYCA